MIRNGGARCLSALPDWFSSQNQGADTAVAEFTGSGRPELLVLMVDAGPEQNRGLYRVGRGLDQDGVVTGSIIRWQWHIEDTIEITSEIRASERQTDLGVRVCLLIA